MSPKNILFPISLGVLGLAGFSVRAELPAPSSSAPAPVAASSVLLLSNGSLLEGEVAEDAEGYTVRKRGGAIRLARRDVERAFPSLADVYEYKRERVPDRDPDEHIKLARWCLSQRLKTQAKEQLQAVLALSPKHPLAGRMLESLEQAEARASVAKLDEAVVRSGGEMEASGTEIVGRPPGLNSAPYRQARQEVGGGGFPTIFDLSPTQSVLRYTEFARQVHPILQRNCVRCHDERYAGPFQLVPVKTLRDRTPEILRANLDSTLGLVDRENPLKSDLLAMALVPHGSGPTKRPIFRSASDPGYQILAAWVSKLHPPRRDAGVRPAGLGAAEPAQEEAFAADRSTPRPLPTLPAGSSLAPRPAPPAFPNEVTPRPPGQFLPGSQTGRPLYAPADAEFPVPYLMGGEKPKPRGTAPAPALPADRPGSPAPPAPPGAANEAVAEAAPETPAAEKKKAKPVKIDPALLQRALMNRYAPH